MIEESYILSTSQTLDQCIGKAQERSLNLMEMNSCCCYNFQGKMQLFHKVNAPLCFLFNALYQKDHNNVSCKYHPEPTAGSCCSCMLWWGYLDLQDGSLSAAAGRVFEWLLLIGEVPQRNFLKYYITGKFSRD